MQEFEKKESTVKLTVAGGSGPKKAPPGVGPKKDSRQFVEELIGPAMKTLEDSQKAVPSGTRAAQERVPNGGAKKVGPKLEVMHKPASMRADLEARKPSPDRFKPKARPAGDGNLGNKIINTLIVLIILAGLGLAGKVGYEQYIAPKRMNEITAIRNKLEDTELKYRGDGSSLASAFASVTCGTIATSIEKVQVRCSLGNCSSEEEIELGKVIDQFNDFCSTVGPHKINKLGEPPAQK